MLYPVELRPRWAKVLGGKIWGERRDLNLDHWNHNPALYQLSYARRPEEIILTSVEPEDKPFP